MARARPPETAPIPAPRVRVAHAPPPAVKAQSAPAPRPAKSAPQPEPGLSTLISGAQQALASGLKAAGSLFGY